MFFKYFSFQSRNISSQELWKYWISCKQGWEMTSKCREGKGKKWGWTHRNRFVLFLFLFLGSLSIWFWFLSTLGSFHPVKWDDFTSKPRLEVPKSLHRKPPVWSSVCCEMGHASVASDPHMRSRAVLRFAGWMEGPKWVVGSSCS